MSFPPSNYTVNQNSVRRWDNILNNLRREIAHLRRLTLKGRKGPLSAGNNGLVIDNGGVTPSTDPVSGFLALNRIFLNFDVNYYFTPSDEIINPELWEVSYNVGSNTALTDGHHYTVPNSIGDLSLVDKDVYLQVNFKMNMETSYDGDSALVTISLFKNDQLVCLMTMSEQYYVGSYLYTFKEGTFSMNDIIECTAGDTFDFLISNNGELKFTIESGSHETSATFSVLRVLDSMA